ncbi:hypothetical protein C5167_029102 [Papaver somniferum]|nr:hypothetical protein C5167_029102 [Papaver somniferum]
MSFPTKRFNRFQTACLSADEWSSGYEEESTELQYQLPTRVEAPSGLIWKCLIDIDQGKIMKEATDEPPAVTVYLLTHAINMRSRIVPPNSFGNMACLAVAPHVSMNDGRDNEVKDKDYPDLVSSEFGFGKPTWISISSIPFKNMVVLMDTSSGDGIEATVSLDIEDAADFEHRLLAFMS